MDRSQVAADGVRVAGVVARAAVLQGTDPDADVGGDAGCQLGELVVQPHLDGGHAIILEQPSARQDFGDSSDADPVAVQHTNQLRVSEAVALAVAGQ